MRLSNKNSMFNTCDIPVKLHAYFVMSMIVTLNILGKEIPCTADDEFQSNWNRKLDELGR